MEKIMTVNGDLATLLNNFRKNDPRRGFSHLDLYLTNKCDRECRYCYTDSRRGLNKTDMNLEIVHRLIEDFRGIDAGTLTGGEISILKDIDTIISKAAGAFGKLFVQTNAIGFVSQKSFHSLTPVTSVFNDLRRRFLTFPPNVEIVLPATEMHMSSKLGGRDQHRILLQSASLLAHLWKDNYLFPQIRFIVKDTPMQTGSGRRIIDEFHLDGLAKTGMEAYPGNIVGNGRAKGMDGVKDPTQLVTTKSLDRKFEGGLAINFKGVFTSEGGLLKELLPIKMQGDWLEVSEPKICDMVLPEDYPKLKHNIKEFLMSQN